MSPSEEPLLSVEAARERVLAAIAGPTSVETHAPDTALGHVLAAPVVATTDLPPWDNSAMDGYAIRSADVAGATETGPLPLRVVGEVPAGGVERDRGRDRLRDPDRDRRPAPGRCGRRGPGRAHHAARRRRTPGWPARP